MHAINCNQISPAWIHFSAKATFIQSAHVNKRVYWSEVNVWAGIIGSLEIGLIFFNDNVTGGKYQPFL